MNTPGTAFCCCGSASSWSRFPVCAVVLQPFTVHSALASIKPLARLKMKEQHWRFHEPGPLIHIRVYLDWQVSQPISCLQAVASLYHLNCQTQTGLSLGIPPIIHLVLLSLSIHDDVITPWWCHQPYFSLSSQEKATQKVRQLHIT